VPRSNMESPSPVRPDRRVALSAMGRNKGKLRVSPQGGSVAYFPSYRIDSDLLPGVATVEPRSLGAITKGREVAGELHKLSDDSQGVSSQESTEDRLRSKSIVRITTNTIRPATPHQLNVTHSDRLILENRCIPPISRRHADTGR
jgi:hypothetical protein